MPLRRARDSGVPGFLAVSATHIVCLHITDEFAGWGRMHECLSECMDVRSSECMDSALSSACRMYRKTWRQYSSKQRDFRIISMSPPPRAPHRILTVQYEIPIKRIVKIVSLGTNLVALA